MVNGITKAPPKGRKEIALLRHYRCVVLDQQSHLALMFYSQLYHLLPNSAPVSPRIFDELHKLDSMAWELEQSLFHPASNWDAIRTIERALETFTERRSSFIDDHASLKASQRAFLNVKKLLDDRLRRYNFIQQVIESSRNGPTIGSTVESSNPDQKWVYGFVPSTTPQTGAKGPLPVQLRDGISGYEVMLEAAPRFSSTDLTFTSSLAPRTVGPLDMQPSQATVSNMAAYIVGWTLSCRTTTREKKAFTVKFGGLTQGGLEIEVKPVRKLRATGLGASTWRCRIYFVTRNEYDFV